MSKQESYIEKCLPFALQTQAKTGISAIAILAQAALESDWGTKAPGNMYFGVKDTDGINGNEQLITTTEYHSTMNVKYPVVLKIQPVIRNGRKLFKYTVKDYFRRFDTPEGSFTHHANMISKSRIYKKAMEVKHDPIAFVKAVAAAGYATDPDYARVMVNMVISIKNRLK